MQIEKVNSDYSLLMMVSGELSTGFPTLLSTTMNAQTSNTVIQMICMTITSRLKTRKGRFLVRYPDFLKNGIFFNIIRSVGDICAFKSKHDHGRNEKSYAYNSVHNDIFDINRVKKRGRFLNPSGDRV
ncbi:hypothetical protein ACFW38_003330 [Salmonella enterica]